MTVNKTKKKRKKLRHNNIVYVIETVILTAAAVFLSVISGMLFADLTGLLCIVAASALITCVLFLTSASVMLISGVASFAITFAINGNIICALASLIYIIIGAFIYFGVRTKKNRTQITVGVTVFLTVFYIALLVLYFILETGTFSINMLSSMLDSELTKGTELLLEQYNSMLAQSSGAVAEEAAEVAYLMEDYAKELVMNLKAIIPACFIVYNAVIAYLSTSLFKMAYNIFIPMANPGRKKIKNKYWRINISVVSAIVLIATLFMAFMFSKNDNVIPSIVLMNLIYILAPGFCVMGVYLIHDKIFKAKVGILQVMLIIGAIMLVFVFPVSVVFILYSMASILMAIGLYSAVIDDIRKFLDKAKKALLGDENDDDDDDYIE